MKKLLILLLIVPFFFACKDDASSSSEPETKPDPKQVVGLNEGCDDNHICDTDLICKNGKCVPKQNNINACGDGDLDDGEECDGQMFKDTSLPLPEGVKCNNCQIDLSNVIRGACGDGNLDWVFGEECEDGNTIDGDGCSSKCKIEPINN